MLEDKEIITDIKYIDAVLLGYEIYTNKQVISIMIENSSSCCESWGIITTEDSIKDFIGSELISINEIDIENNEHPLVEGDLLEYSDELATVFIDINTSVGTLQFVLYNIHNGYYGHDVTVTSNQFKLESAV